MQKLESLRGSYHLYLTDQHLPSVTVDPTSEQGEGRGLVESWSCRVAGRQRRSLKNFVLTLSGPFVSCRSIASRRCSAALTQDRVFAAYAQPRLRLEADISYQGTTKSQTRRRSDKTQQVESTSRYGRVFIVHEIMMVEVERSNIECDSWVPSWLCASCAWPEDG